MMAMNLDDPARLHGLTVFGSDDKKLGSIEAVYYDNVTTRPEWVAVVSGLFGNHVSLMPLARAEFTGGNLRVPYEKERLQTAPHHDIDRQLSGSEEAELFRHYGIPYDEGSGEAGRGSTPRTTGMPAPAGEAGAESPTGNLGQTGHNRDPQTAGERDDLDDGSDDAMTRSEERLKVGTETREAGRARLRKHVVTEHHQVTVPVSHEEVRVQHEPITEANRGAACEGPTISEAEHEVVLHEERPVVDKETVPVERVRLDTEEVTEQETVGDEVRHEEIELESEGHTVQETDRDTR